MSSDLNEISRPGFRLDDSNEDPNDSQTISVTPRRRRLNDRLMDEIAVIESTIPRSAPEVQQENAPFLGRKADLDGINPMLPFGGFIFAALASYGSWQLTLWLASRFSELTFGENTFYAIERITIVIRTAVIGGIALGCGVAGVTSIGLLALSIRVTVGLLTGELDMDAPQTSSRGLMSQETEENEPIH